MYVEATRQHIYPTIEATRGLDYLLVPVRHIFFLVKPNGSGRTNSAPGASEPLDTPQKIRRVCPRHPLEVSTSYAGGSRIAVCGKLMTINQEIGRGYESYESTVIKDPCCVRRSVYNIHTFTHIEHDPLILFTCSGGVVVVRLGRRGVLALAAPR